MMVSACHQTRLSLDEEGVTLTVSAWKTLSLWRKGSRWSYLSLRAIRLDCLWIAKGDYNSLGRKTLSLRPKGANDHNLSLQAIGLDCLRIANETSIILETMKSGRPWFVPAYHRTCLSLDGKGGTVIVSVERHWVFDHRGQMTIFVSAHHRTWWSLDDHNLSLRANGLACL